MNLEIIDQTTIVYLAFRCQEFRQTDSIANPQSTRHTKARFLLNIKSYDVVFHPAASRTLAGFNPRREALSAMKYLKISQSETHY